MPDYSKGSEFTWRDQHASIYEDGSSPTEFHEIRNVGSFGVKAIRLCRNSNQNVDPASPELVLGMALSGSPSVRWSWGDKWRFNPARTRGQFGLSPIGEPGYFDVEGRHEVLVFSFPISRIRLAIEEGESMIPLDFKSLHDFYRYDDTVFRLANTLWDLGNITSAAADFEAEAAAIYLLARLARLAEDGTPKVTPQFAPLSLLEQKIVVDYIHSHLASSMTMASLSKQVGMSVRQFHGSFVATFGSPPSSYVRAVRLAKARELIRVGKPLGEVVAACGFADQSHMTRLYRSQFGVTPGADRGV